jgi:hypothetical protein
MQKLKPLHVAHADLLVSLHDWFRAKKTFGCEKAWPEAYNIRGRLEKAADLIHECVRMLRVPSELYIDLVSIKMTTALYDGTGLMLEHCNHPSVLASWQDVCVAVESFARCVSYELDGLGLNYHDNSGRSLAYVSGAMDGTADEAVRCREIVNRRVKED